MNVQYKRHSGRMEGKHNTRVKLKVAHNTGNKICSKRNETVRQYRI